MGTVLLWVGLGCRGALSWGTRGTLDCKETSFCHEPGLYGKVTLCFLLEVVCENRRKV